MDHYYGECDASPQQLGLDDQKPKEKLMPDSPKYEVYQDKEQWLPFFNWFWIRPGETGMGHGAYPARWIAKLSAWWHNR